MNRAAHLAESETNIPGEILALDSLRAASVVQEPFPFFIVPRFVKAEALDAIRADFPVIRHPGSFPLTTLEYGPAFAAFMADIQSAEMTKLIGAKLNMDLSTSPTMVTVRGQSRAKSRQARPLQDPRSDATGRRRDEHRG